MSRKGPKDRPQSTADFAQVLALIDVELWSEEQEIRWWNVNPDRLRRSSYGFLQRLF